MNRHKKIHLHRLEMEDVKDDFKKINLEPEDLEKRVKNKKQLKMLQK